MNASSGDGMHGHVLAHSRLVSVSWEDRDLAWWVTLTALIGLGLGVLLAIFGLPPVDTHAPWHRLGIMDPLCGGTRALRFTLQGEWHDAWRYNPLSPILAVGAALAVLRHMVGTLTGRWLTIRASTRLLIVIAVRARALGDQPATARHSSASPVNRLSG